MNRTDFIMNSSGTKGKFSIYDRAVSTISSYLLKTILYLLSWIIKIWSKFEIPRAKKNKKIGKAKFYIIWFHQKIHFGLFNMFITNGVMLTTRTILHIRTLPSTPLLIIDKIVAFLCSILFTIDFMDLLLTTIDFSRKNTSKELKIMRKKID